MRRELAWGAKLTSLLLAGALALASPSWAQSPEALAAADRLMAVQDSETMMRDIAVKTAATLPLGVREAFVAEMTDPAFLERLNSVMRVAMAKHLTVEELDALSDFYSKPVAKSAMAKMGNYMAEVMPFLEQEITRWTKKR